MLTILLTGYLSVMLLIVVALCLAARRPTPEFSTSTEMDELAETTVELESPEARRSVELPATEALAWEV